MPQAAGLRARGGPPWGGEVLLLDRARTISVSFLTSTVTYHRRRRQSRNFSTQDEYCHDLRCFYIQLRIQNSGLGKNFYVVFSVGHPGSLMQSLSLVKCWWLSTGASMVWSGETVLCSTSDAAQRRWSMQKRKPAGEGLMLQSASLGRRRLQVEGRCLI